YLLGIDGHADLRVRDGDVEHTIGLTGDRQPSRDLEHAAHAELHAGAHEREGVRGDRLAANRVRLRCRIDLERDRALDDESVETDEGDRAGGQENVLRG